VLVSQPLAQFIEGRVGLGGNLGSDLIVQIDQLRRYMAALRSGRDLTRQPAAG